jgi:hypothetical protein
MNAPERVRAFLTAHQAPGGETWTSGTAVIAVATAENCGEQFRLTEPDLEATLQTIEILTSVLATYAMRNPPAPALLTAPETETAEVQALKDAAQSLLAQYPAMKHDGLAHGLHVLKKWLLQSRNETALAVSERNAYKQALQTCARAAIGGERMPQDPDGLRDVVLEALKDAWRVEENMRALLGGSL